MLKKCKGNYRFPGKIEKGLAFRTTIKQTYKNKNVRELHNHFYGENADEIRSNFFF